VIYFKCCCKLITEKKIAEIADILKQYIKRLSQVPLLQQRKLISFLFFVLLSTAFWFVRSLGEQYETSVTYPVRYANLPENKLLVGKVPEKLTLKIRAKGFTIVKCKLNLNLIPLRFNVNSFLLNSIGSDSFYVVTEKVQDILSAELDNVTILDIYPDTLFFRFTEMMVKKVAVMPMLAMHDKFFFQQFMQNGKIIVKPDSIIISGPGSSVRLINHVQTEPLNFTNLADTVEVDCELESIDMITFSMQKVKVSIPVDRFTEVKERHTIVPVNIPDSLNMIAIPGQIIVTYRICLSNYNRILNNPMTPRIDYNAILENHVSRLSVFLTDTPDYINNIRFNPKETEFLITRK